MPEGERHFYLNLIEKATYEFHWVALILQSAIQSLQFWDIP